jgi:hypothetical protein
MSKDHIVHLLEERSFSHLSAAERNHIAAHTAVCAECSRAYEAAQLVAALLQERATTVVAPPPFFQTRVLAALRERKQETEAFGLRRLWQAAKPLLAAMTVLVLLLTSVTFYSGDDVSPAPAGSVASFNTDPVDLVVYGPESFEEQEFTNTLVFSDIYELEMEDINGN